MTTRERKVMRAVAVGDLAAAADLRDPDAVRRLLEEGADPNKPMQIPFLQRTTSQLREELPIVLAATHDNAEIVQILVDAGADVNQTFIGECKETPLFSAAANNSCKCVTVLLECGAKVNEATNGGHTPVFVAAEMGHDEALQLLLEHGGSANQGNTYGDTPLLVAARGNHVGAAHLLLAHGADVNSTNSFRETAGWVAAEHESSECQTLIEQHGGSCEPPAPPEPPPEPLVEDISLALSSDQIQERISADLGRISSEMLAEEASPAKKLEKNPFPKEAGFAWMYAPE